MDAVADATRSGELDTLVDHLFRRESGRLVARLLRALGPEHFELAEEAVQEAMMQALRSWPLAGTPKEPAAWLSKVAKNRALDVLRRRTSFENKRPDVVSLMEARLERLPEPGFSGEIEDDQLRLIFTCCHPTVPGDARIALTLKTVCGFSVAEIARAFMAKESTVAQRLTRAKRLIAERGIPYAVPPPQELHARSSSVLKVVYLMFNEGYSPGGGEAVIRADICEEACRLARVLADHPLTGSGASQALAALLLLQGARLPTREGPNGEILLLEEQDRTRWSAAWLEEGFRRLRAAMETEELTPYHLEAGIAACHAAAPTYADTDWPAILAYYEQLEQIQPSPVTTLNRAIAVAMVEGPEAGLRLLGPLGAERELSKYYLLPATEAELLRRSGERDQAAESLRRALDLATSEPVKRLLEKRLAACIAGD